MQRQNDSVQLKHHLLGVGRCLELMRLDCLRHRPHQFTLPATHHADQNIPDRTGPIVVLRSTGNKNAPMRRGVNGASDPSLKNRRQALEASRAGQGGAQNVRNKTGLVGFEDHDLQLLARAEMSKNTALRHLSMLGQLTDRQPLKALLRRNL